MSMYSRTLIQRAVNVKHSSLNISSCKLAQKLAVYSQWYDNVYEVVCKEKEQQCLPRMHESRQQRSV
jgi:transcription elongation factor Elf1